MINVIGIVGTIILAIMVVALVFQLAKAMQR